MSANHFISVSRRGELIARRKGQPPVRIADAARGLAVSAPPQAVARGVPSSFTVFFAHGGHHRDIRVTDVLVDHRRLAVEVFQRELDVSDDELGAWMRAAVEQALDAAAI